MNLYILKPRETLPEDDNPWDPWYDKMFAVIVRAENEESARHMAACAGGDEVSRPFAGSPGNFKSWEDPHYSTCEILSSDGDEEVIITDVKQA
jgi:hypothetical protein